MKNTSCGVSMTLKNIVRGLMVRVNDGGKVTPIITPAIKIKVSTYASEISPAMRQANFTDEQYMRKCCKKSTSGELAMNVVLIDGETFTPYHDCGSFKNKKSSIDDMFCLDSNGLVALKLTYVF